MSKGPHSLWMINTEILNNSTIFGMQSIVYLSLLCNMLLLPQMYNLNETE